MKSLIILGAGGHGKVVAETALATKKYQKISFLDDKFSKDNFSKDFLEINIIGDLSFSEELKKKNSFTHAIVAIGNSKIRLQWINKLKELNYIIPSILHPTAWISPSSNIHEGTVVFAQAAIQSNAIIGKGSIINTSSSVDHDCIIHEGVHICPGARLAGDVQVGEKSIIGIGSSINEGIIIGKNVIVGAGAAVISNLDDNVIAKGVPAKLK